MGGSTDPPIFVPTTSRDLIPGASWSLDDLVVRPLDGPPDSGFDCGRAEQNEFLYDRAWEDYQARSSVTRLFYVNGICAGYATTVMTGFTLTMREKPRNLVYKVLPAALLAQMAVHRPYQGTGLGRFIVGYVVEMALQIGDSMGCRFVILHAQPDLVDWYEAQGFEVIRSEQAARRARAQEAGDDPDRVPVAMYFDLRER